MSENNKFTPQNDPLEETVSSSPSAGSAPEPTPQPISIPVFTPAETVPPVSAPVVNPEVPNQEAPYQGAPYQGAPYQGTPYPGAPAEKSPQQGPAYYTPPIPQFVYDAPVRPRKVRQKKASCKSDWSSPKKLIPLVLCLSLLGGLVGGVISSALCRNRQDNTCYYGEGNNNIGGNAVIQEGNREKVTIEKQPIDTSKQKSIQQVYADNVDSIVGISTNFVTENWWGGKQEGGSAGSGVVYSADGYILTNHHVIDKAETITVYFHNGTNMPATLIGYDENNDIAVLKVNATDLQPAILGDSDNLIVGDTVLAIGNPLGELTFALTSGVVSTPPRNVTMSENLNMTLIQTDCAINSGNSGGGLFNLYGELIGITNAKYSTNGLTQATIDNIGFAIPISDIKYIIEGMITKGEYEKPYIGISANSATQSGTDKNTPAGVLIAGVENGLPAAKAGILPGDIITQFGDAKIQNFDDLRNAVKKCKNGEKIEVTVYRNGEYIKLELIMGVQTYPALPK